MSTLFEFAPTGTVTNGAAVAVDPADSTKYDTLSGDVTYDTAVKFKDLVASAKCNNPGSTVATLDQVLAAAVSTRRLVRVVKTSAFTSGTFTTLTRVRNPSNSGLYEVRRNSAGALILRDDQAGTALATAAALPFTSAFRYEWDIVGGTSPQQTLRIYSDPAADTPSQTLGPFAWAGGSFDRIVDGVSTAAAGIVANILYAADGDSENPSLNRWVTPGAGEGIRTYIVSGGAEVLLTSTTI